mgnify:CR=1 FL=1
MGEEEKGGERDKDVVGTGEGGKARRLEGELEDK